MHACMGGWVGEWVGGWVGGGVQEQTDNLGSVSGEERREVALGKPDGLGHLRAQEELQVPASPRHVCVRAQYVYEDRRRGLYG